MPLDRSIVVVDTETATLSAPHLLKLGAVKVEDGEVVDTFETLVAPLVEIEPEATDIHGITNDDVRRSPMAGSALEQFTEWAGDAWLCAHNAGFDARVLGFEAPRPARPSRDAVPLHAQARPAPHPRVAGHKLETLCQHLDLDEGEHHRALADSVWCWQVLEECARRAETTNAASSWPSAAAG